MIDSWTQALCVVPPQFCGRRLRPFSLSHSVLLRVLQNPYAYRDVPASRSDLMAAALVCSRTHDENRAALFGGQVRALPLMAWAWRWRRADFALADANFRQYIAEHTRYAPRDEEGGHAKDAPAAPTEYHLHRTLCRVYGIPAGAAWDYPLGLARAYYDCDFESRGGKGLQSEYEQTVAELSRREAAAREAGDVAAAEAAWDELAKYVARSRGAA